MNRDWRNFFTAEDFYRLHLPNRGLYILKDDAKAIANVANLFLREALDASPEMSARIHSNCMDLESGIRLPMKVWEAVTTNPVRGFNPEKFTHTARLIDIREIKCEKSS